MKNTFLTFIACSIFSFGIAQTEKNVGDFTKVSSFDKIDVQLSITDMPTDQRSYTEDFKSKFLIVLEIVNSYTRHLSLKAAKKNTLQKRALQTD